MDKKEEREDHFTAAKHSWLPKNCLFTNEETGITAEY